MNLLHLFKRLFRGSAGPEVYYRSTELGKETNAANADGAVSVHPGFDYKKKEPGSAPIRRHPSQFETGRRYTRCELYGKHKGR